MIDFHSHILPDMDDGSSNLEETKELLEAGYEQGVHIFVATSHFYASQDSIGRFLEKRTRRMEQTRKAIEGREGPEIVAGAEVYYFPHMGTAQMLPRLCVEGTSILLLEMPFVQWTERMLQDVRNIVDKQKLQVVLAHVERYYEFQKNKKVWDAIFELPICAQFNAGCFLGRKKRKFALQFLENDIPVLLGSDCHNMEYRPPNLAAGRKVIEEKLGRDILRDVDELGMRLLKRNG